MQTGLSSHRLHGSSLHLFAAETEQSRLRTTVQLQCQEHIRGRGGKERVTRASAKPGEIWRECYFWKSSTHLTSTTTGNHHTASIFCTAQGFRLHYRPYAFLPEVTRSFPPASYALLTMYIYIHDACMQHITIIITKYTIFSHM